VFPAPPAILDIAPNLPATTENTPIFGPLRPKILRSNAFITTSIVKVPHPNLGDITLNQKNKLLSKTQLKNPSAIKAKGVSLTNQGGIYL